MASLSRLKTLMMLTMFLVFGTGFVLIMVLSFTMRLPMSVSLILVGLYVVFQWFMSPLIVGWSTKLRFVKKGEIPWLEEELDRMSKKAQIPTPALAIVPDPTPNAFVFGRTKGSSTLAIHEGLLRSLNKDEIRAVIGHELGHLRHGDCVIMTLVSAVPLIAFTIARSIFWTGGRGGGRKSVGAIFALAIASYIIYFISMVLVKWLSRAREYYADAYSAYSTGKPHDLASALSKITYGLSLAKGEPSGLRAFHIGDMSMARREIGSIMSNKSKFDLDRDGVLDEHELELAMKSESGSSWSSVNELFSTHPSTFKRIKMLDKVEKEIRTSGVKQDAVYKFI